MDVTKLPTAALSSAYAQVAGLLAGFAFVCLTAYLGNEQHAAKKQQKDPLGRRISVTLFSAFAALVLISVLYALLTGEKDATARANTALIIVGLPFGLSILTLFFALTLMAAERDFMEMVRLGLVLVAIVGPAIVYARLMNAVAAVDTRPHEGWSPYSTGMALVLGLLITSSTVSWIIKKKDPGNDGKQFPLATVVTTHAGLVISVVAAVLSSIVIGQSETYRPSRPILYGTAIGVFLLLAAFATCAAWAIRRAINDNPTSAAQEQASEPDKKSRGAGEEAQPQPHAPEQATAHRLSFAIEWRPARPHRRKR